MAEVVRTLIIRSKTEGVQESTTDLKRLSTATDELGKSTSATASVTDMATRSQLTMAQALSRATQQITAGIKAQNDAKLGLLSTADAAGQYGHSIVSAASDTLNLINHLKLVALGAYALFPAFRSFVNSGIKEELKALPAEFGLLYTGISKVASVAAPALSFFSRMAIPIGAAVAAFEALNFVITQGSDLLQKYSDRTKELFPNLDQDLEKLTKFQKETLTSDQVQLATELGGRLAAAKRELSQVLQVQIDTTTSALQLQNAWVFIVERIAAGATFLGNLKTNAEAAAQAFGNLSIFGKGGEIIEPAAGGGNAAAQQAAALARARENLAVGLGGGTSFAARFGAVTDKPKTETETTKATGEFERLADSISRATAAQEANALSEGKGAGEVARLRTEFRLMEAAQEDIIKNGGDLNTYADRIAKVAQRAGEAAKALERAKLASEISFGRQTALLSPEDVQIAQQLRGLYGDDVPRALRSTQAEALRLNDVLKQNRAAADEFINTSMNNLTTGLADITTGAKDAGLAFKDLSAAVIRALEEMIIKMTITLPIARALQSAIGGFSPGGGVGPASADEGSYFAGTSLHTGGVVGSEGTTRYIHPAYFENAPRFHSGLFPGELPAILQRGESVLTAGQMSAIGGALRGPTVVNNVNVQNAPQGTSVQQKTNATGGSDITIILEQVEHQIAGNVADGRGSLNSALTNRYGLTPKFS